MTNKRIRIAVDAMGGDFAPRAIVLVQWKPAGNLILRLFW